VSVPSTLKVPVNYLLHAGLHALAEAVATAEAVVRLPVAETLGRRYEEATAGGWANADISAVVELLRKRPRTVNSRAG
jgi:hypothetical protein